MAAMKRALTYCNPLPLPDYPRGRASRDPSVFAAFADGVVQDFRETADPTVIYHDGKWILYPSAAMAYVSEDFVTWRHHPIEPADCGYAPTVVKFGQRWLLTACRTGLWTADDPLGPFELLGEMTLPGGEAVPRWDDPMLFADDDGRLYAYWGLGPTGIRAAELDGDHPTRLLSDPVELIAFDPAEVWQRYGEHNEDASRCFMEGPWMLKHGGRYYLTFAAPGTEFSTYAMGAAVGDSPLGPFTLQANNPICADRYGLVRGPGHGCIVAGPGGTYWAFYTCAVCVHHSFERRIGMDPAGFDEHGQLFVNAASETPQWAPGVVDHPADDNATGLLPVNHGKIAARSSSAAPGRDTRYATDGSMKTWWQPAEGDRSPSLTIPLGAEFIVSAARIIWSEPQLNYADGKTPAAIPYRLEGRAAQDAPWEVLIDASSDQTEMLIDYRPFNPRQVRELRLSWDRSSLTMTVGVTDFSVFGHHVKLAPPAVR